MKRKQVPGKKRRAFWAWGPIVLAIAAAGTLRPAPGAATELVDRIVAVVNEDVLLLSELNRELRPYVERVRAAGFDSVQENQRLFQIREEILDQMINQKLTDQEVERNRIFVSEKEVDNTIERIKEANFYTEEDMRRMMAESGLEMEAYRQRIREQILRSKLVNREVKSKIVITQEDIRKHYEAHPERYGGEKRYHLHNIMMAGTAGMDPAAKRAARERMEKIRESLKTGTPYDRSGITGMDLGLIGFQKLAPRLQEVLGGMRPKEFSPVVDTDQGLQIFFVEEIVDTPGITLEEAGPEIERKLYEEVVNRHFTAWLEDLRAQSHIKIIQ